jgi:hypothetical protein
MPCLWSQEYIKDGSRVNILQRFHRQHYSIPLVWIVSWNFDLFLTLMNHEYTRGVPAGGSCAWTAVLTTSVKQSKPTGKHMFLQETQSWSVAGRVWLDKRDYCYMRIAVETYLPLPLSIIIFYQEIISCDLHVFLSCKKYISSKLNTWPNLLKCFNVWSSIWRLNYFYPK